MIGKKNKIVIIRFQNSKPQNERDLGSATFQGMLSTPLDTPNQSSGLGIEQMSGRIGLGSGNLVKVHLLQKKKKK